MGLARGAARGAAWNFGTVLAERGIGFVVLGILIRHIPASVVGLVAVGSAISDLARMAANSGAGAQVQAAPGDAEVEAAAFWSQFWAALGLTIALVLAAPALAGGYGEPALAPVLRALAFNILLTAFLIVPSARLAAKFEFRTLGLISLGSTVLGCAVALPCAFAGQAVAALVAQRMVGVAFYAAVASACAGWRPPRPPGWPVLRRAYRFSLPLMQAAFVDYLSLTGYVMLIGLRMPAAALGRFRIAQRLVEVLQEIAFLPANKVFLPVFVAVRDDPARRYEATRQLLDLLAMAIFCSCAVAGAAAEPLVRLMFGPRWLAAAPVFAVLTFLAPVTALYGVIEPLLTAGGRAHLVSRFAAVNAATILAVAWFAAPHGLVVLAWSLTARGVLGLALVFSALRLGLGRPVLPLARLLVLPFAALLAARAAAAAALAAAPGLAAFGQLVLGAGVAAAVFVALVACLAPRRMRAMTARLHGALLRTA